jgi:hypothetical protein
VQKQKVLRPVLDFYFIIGTSEKSNFLHNIEIQIVYVVLMFQKFWSYRSMDKYYVITYCPDARIIMNEFTTVPKVYD